MPENAATAVVEPTNGGPSKKKKENENEKEKEKEKKKRPAQDDIQEEDTSNPHTKIFKARVPRAPRERT